MSVSTLAVAGLVARRQTLGSVADSTSPSELNTSATRYGAMIRPSFATAAADRAIKRAVDWTSRCPMAFWAVAAGSVASSAPGGNSDRSTGRSKGTSSLKPNLSAESASSKPPTSMPSCANTVLHDRTNAISRVTDRPSLHTSPSKFSMVAVLPGSGRAWGSSNSVEGLTAPVSSPDAVVTTLKIEPGAYDSSVARFRNGSSGSSARASPTGPALGPTRVFGSNRGDVTMARTAPVSGSSATTAPR